MTCWYAPASASGVPQFGPSLLPLQPPNDGTMSPPAARIAAIALASALPCSGRLPSQAGLQPPDERMKAIVNHLMPVAFITVAGFGGAPQPMYRYGAARRVLVLPPPVEVFTETVVLFGPSPALLEALT